MGVCRGPSCGVLKRGPLHASGMLHIAAYTQGLPTGLLENLAYLSKNLLRVLRCCNAACPTCRSAEAISRLGLYSIACVLLLRRPAL